MLQVRPHGSESKLDKQSLRPITHGHRPVIDGFEVVVEQRLDEGLEFRGLEAASSKRPPDQCRQEPFEHLDAHAQFVRLRHRSTLRGGVSNPTIATEGVLSSAPSEALRAEVPAESLHANDGAALLANRRRLAAAQPAEVSA